MTTRLLSSILALSIALPPAAARAQDPSWPPAASAAYTEGKNAYAAGNYDAALSGYRRAYAAMPEPLIHRQGRDAVLGSLRSTYYRLYEASRERAQLCAWRATLVTHTDELRTRGATGADVQGLEGLRAQVDADVARDFPGDPHCAPQASPAVTPSPAPISTTPVTTPTTTTTTRPPAVMTVPPLQPTATQPAEATPDPRVFRAGGILLGAGIIGLLGMGAGLVVADNREQALIDLEKMTDAAGKITQADRDRADQFRNQGRIATNAAIGAGVAGGVFLVTGVVLMIVGRKGRKNPTVAPTAGIWGLAVHGRF